MAHSALNNALVQVQRYPPCKDKKMQTFADLAKILEQNIAQTASRKKQRVIADANKL